MVNRFGATWLRHNIASTLSTSVWRSRHDAKKSEIESMGMMSEFKDFAMKGNVVDMAVGVVIGGGVQVDR